jgi:hypothetical protein
LLRIGEFPDAADLPVISQVMLSAKMLVTYPVPSAQEWNASVTMSRLDGMAGPIFPEEAGGVSRRAAFAHVSA